MSERRYKVFVSHGSHDTWVAGQLAKEIRACGAEAFLDESSIPKGANFKTLVRTAIADSQEFLALLTPWSVDRTWLWTELGAAWGQGLHIVVVFYGITLQDLERDGRGKGILDDLNVLTPNELPTYFSQLAGRARGLLP